MVRLKTSHEYKWGQTNILPHVGLTKISNEGFIEVETNDIAEKLQDSLEDFFIEAELPSSIIEPSKVDPIIPQVETNELQKTEKDDLGDSEKDEDENSLSGKSEETSSTEDDAKGEVEEIPQDDEEKKELHAALDAMNLASLKEYARNFPSAEWRTFNKELLLTYLKSKI